MERPEPTNRAPAADAKPTVATAPRPRIVSPQAFIAFATFASKFSRGRKPVRFGGNCWRL